jgi:hypothetical protein
VSFNRCVAPDPILTRTVSPFRNSERVILISGGGTDAADAPPVQTEVVVEQPLTTSVALSATTTTCRNPDDIPCTCFLSF